MKIRLRVRKSPTDAFNWEHADSPLRIGRAEDCQLKFQGSVAETVSGRHAQIELSPDGAIVSDLGSTNGSYLNGQRLSAPANLRIGDCLQLGLGGPRIEVIEIDLPVTNSGSESDKASATATRQPRQRVSAAASWRQLRDAAAESPVRKWAKPAAIGLGALIGLFVLYLIVRPSSSSHQNKTAANVLAANASATQASSGTPSKASDPVAPGNGDAVTPQRTTALEDRAAKDDGAVTGQRPTAPDDRAKKDGGATSDAENPVAPRVAIAADSADDAVFLLLVEEPKTASRWPFGTAAAVADHVLLTSATTATGLADFRDQGWKLLASNQRSGLTVEVTDLRVHAGFAGAQAKPEEQIYADLGLLTVKKPLPKLLELASRQELDDLDRGLPITCLGYLYENEPIGRFKTFLPEPRAGKIFIITSLSPSSGGPRLMHIRAELPGKMYGAPVMNEAGRILGVFAETASPPDGQRGTDLHLHYVPVADGEQIDRWIKNHDEQWWVPPRAAKARIRSPRK
jgi:pSer/pThr/pTyr-binding forkhead associated (FHA) protein